MIEDLYQTLTRPEIGEIKCVGLEVKKIPNFVGVSIDSEGKFLFEMRRVKTKHELFTVCDKYLIQNGRGERPFNLEPYDGLIARPSSESKKSFLLSLRVFM